MHWFVLLLADHWSERHGGGGDLAGLAHAAAALLVLLLTSSASASFSSLVALVLSMRSVNLILSLSSFLALPEHTEEQHAAADEAVE